MGPNFRWLKIRKWVYIVRPHLNTPVWNLAEYPPPRMDHVFLNFIFNLLFEISSNCVFCGSFTFLILQRNTLFGLGTDGLISKLEVSLYFIFAPSLLWFCDLGHRHDIIRETSWICARNVRAHIYFPGRMRSFWIRGGASSEVFRWNYHSFALFSRFSANIMTFTTICNRPLQAALLTTYKVGTCNLLRVKLRGGHRSTKWSAIFNRFHGKLNTIILFICAILTSSTNTY